MTPRSYVAGLSFDLLQSLVCIPGSVGSHSHWSQRSGYVARRTLTTSPSQPPTSQDRQNHQQHDVANTAQSVFSAVDFAPKSNVEKSLQQHQHQTPRSDRQTNCSDDHVVCRSSPEVDTVVQTTPVLTMSTTLNSSPPSVDSQNTLLTKCCDVRLL